jgi:hypothetical protein
MNKSKKKS